MWKPNHENHYFVNDRQSPEDRRQKYKYLRQHGVSVELARRGRDFHYYAIRKLIQYFGDNNA